MSQNELRARLLAEAGATFIGHSGAKRFVHTAELRELLNAAADYIGIESAQAAAPGGGEVPREALEKLFRAFVRAGGVMTVARHGVDIDQDEFYRDVQHGVMEIERYLHPERFDEFPTGTAPGHGALARTKADQKWGEWSAVLRRLIGDRTEKLHFAAEVQAVGDGVRFDNCRFINKEPVGYVSFGEYRESCDVTDDQRATWQPVWTSKPDAMLAAAPASEAVGQSVADVADQVMRDAFYGPAGTGVMRIDPSAMFEPAASSYPAKFDRDGSETTDAADLIAASSAVGEPIWQPKYTINPGEPEQEQAGELRTMQFTADMWKPYEILRLARLSLGDAEPLVVERVDECIRQEPALLRRAARVEDRLSNDELARAIEFSSATLHSTGTADGRYQPIREQLTALLAEQRKRATAALEPGK